MEKLLLNNEEAASYLGVTPGVLRLSRHTGELFKGVAAPKFLKLGSSKCSAVRYPRQNLDDWILSHHQFSNNAEVAVGGAA